MVSQKQKVVIALLLTFGGAVLASTDGWQRFSSSSGFSVSYPGSWFRIGVSTDRLQLLSSKGGAEGLVIKPGQAEITVLKAQASQTQTLAEVIAYYTQDTTVLSGRDVPEETGRRGCTDLKEITSEEPAIPPADSPIRVPIIINTDFFCEIHGLKIVTLVRSYYGDKHQEKYKQVALRLAKSIRLLQQEDAR